MAASQVIVTRNYKIKVKKSSGGLSKLSNRNKKRCPSCGRYM